MLQKPANTTLTNKWWSIPLFLLLIIITCLVIWATTGRLPVTVIRSQDGIWDLRDVDFDSACVQMIGEAEYVPGALLTPGEFDLASGKQLGILPVETTCLTSRLRLLVAEDRYFEIAGFVDDFGSRLYVNGKWLTDSGLPASTKEENIPSERFVRFTVEPKDGVIEIVQQTSNFVFRTSTNHTGWTIGRPELVERWAIGFAESYILNIGFYLALFLIHTLLLLLLPSYRANLWFALLCLLWALRTGITRVRPLVVLLQMGWEPALRLEYLTAVGALVLITLGYSVIFPGVIPRLACRVAYMASGVWAVFYLVADTLFMTKTMLLFEIVAGIWALYVILRVTIKTGQLDFKQKIIVAGLAVVLAALVMDTLFYNGVILPFMHNVILETAMLIFSLFQMTSLFLGTMEEVSASRAAEQRLAVENAALDRVNQLKTDMMATISHEMRTPLAVMMGYAQLTAAELKDRGVDEQATADLDAIAAEAKRLARLVEEMQSVSLARQWEENVGSTSAAAVIQQIIRLYAPILERKGRELSAGIPPHLPPVHCGMGELTQMLFNLINNADKHGKYGPITVTAARAGAFVAVTVTDKGKGIAPELLPHVFEKYQQDGGTGLGLYICREIVEARGGRISAESFPGEGAAVCVELPVAEEG